MGFTITYELDETPDRKLTRRELARLLGCHYNTLRDDELLIKQWVPDAGKYYYSDNPSKLEAVELTPYLIWLLVQVRNLKAKGYSSKSIARLLFIEKPEQFSEKGFNAYVLNPSASSPQATKEQHSKGMAIYEGNSRALDLIGAAFDVTAKNFTVMGKHAKAVSSGVKAATAIEATKGDVLDYMKQQQVTQQKGIDYGIAAYTTNINRQVAAHTKVELDEKLKQATIKGEDAQLKTVEKQQALDSFKAQLGQYLPQAK